MTIVLDERFWSKVAPAGGLECWTWARALNGDGYAQFRYAGAKRSAHRLTYEMLRAEIPAGLQLDHVCRNRACVNPWHLEPVTQLVNARRGNAGAWQRARTTCPRGHAYNYVCPKGSRRCQACTADRKRESRALKAA